MLLTLLCLLLTLPAAASEWRVVSSEPGNVFIEGAPVLFRVAGRKEETPLRFQLMDYEGKTRTSGEVSGPEIRVSRGICPPGYYELETTDGARSVKTPFVVVRKPRVRRTDRLAVDAAHSWLIPPERFEEGAEMLRRAGFGWARERISWGEVEPERGVLRWGKYDRSAEAARKRGIHIAQVFHHTPAWARSDREGMRYPDDLRDIFRFCKAAAEHYRGSVQAWEVWNESDIPVFSPEPGSDYAAFLKAAYLGFKAGDPNVLVTQVSLALAAPRFHESLYKNGTAAYFDIFNYHIYDAPRNYPARARGHFSIMDRFSAPAAPVWMTEAGIPLRAVNNTLTPEDKRKQAEFIPKSFVMSLVSGTDRHFFFVFPHYLENGVEFGVMDADLKPYPGYAALATVTAMLGEARYRGRIRLPDAPEAEARLFDNGKDETLVLWSDQKAAEARLPVDVSKARVVNCVGTEQKAERAAEGGLLLTVGSAPLYVQAPRGSFPDVVDDAVRRAVKPEPILYAGRDLVLRVIPPKEAFRKGRERYEFPAGRTARLQVEAYNFGEEAGAGTIQLRAPAGWMLSPDRFDGVFAPMGREVFLATLTVPENPGLQAQEIEAVIRPRDGETWGAGKPQSAPAVIDIAVDPNSLKPTETADLDLNRPEAWQDNISANGSMSHRADAETGVAFDIRFTQPGDRWAYPTVPLPEERDWRPYDGISLEMAADVEDSGTRLRLILVEKSGAAYFTEEGYPAATTWKRVFIPFSSLSPGAFAPADPNGRLDLDQIALLRFGCNTARDRITLRVRNLALARLPRPSAAGSTSE